MKQNSKNTIIISDYFDNQLNSRANVKSFFNKLNIKKNTTLDFSNIDFISRSSAHELLSLINKLSEQNIKIKMINLSKQVNEMLEKVADSIRTNFKRKTYVNYINIQSKSALDSYLMTL